MTSEFKTGRYTVTRINGQQVKVTAPNAPARYIHTVGSTVTCGCPKYGQCGHVLAVNKFIVEEAKAETANNAGYVSLDEKFAWD
jgi:hypothetical protein